MGPTAGKNSIALVLAPQTNRYWYRKKASRAIELQGIFKLFNHSSQELQQWLNLCRQLSL
jgi:hypothetical protein